MRETTRENTARRLALAHGVIDYLMGLPAGAYEAPVPNCPGWSVYNAAVHVGRVGVFWEEMIGCPPEDGEARTRALATMTSLPEGVSVEQLAGWAHRCIDGMDTPEPRPCFFSMTGGPGDTWLWAWHASAELGVHRLDVEAALGHDHALGVADAVDAIDYGRRYFLPAMRRVVGEDPGRLTLEPLDDHGRPAAEPIVLDALDGDGSATATVRGPAVKLLLYLFGRPHDGVEVSGSSAVAEAWPTLPARSYQFGAWD